MSRVSFLSILLGSISIVALIISWSSRPNALNKAKASDVRSKTTKKTKISNHDTVVPVDVKLIAEKWELVSAASMSPITRKLSLSLLEKQIQLINPNYDEMNDLIVFFHPLKTGGTSISNLLNTTFTAERVVPGSRRSNWFQWDDFREATAQHRHEKNGLKKWWKDMKVLYTHTGFRGNKRDSIRLRQIINKSRKRVRLLTMIRDPIAWRASNYFEWMCQIMTWQFQQRRRQGLPKDSCPEIDQTGSVAELRLRNERLDCDRYPNYKDCKSLAMGVNPYEHCSSVSALLNSDIYEQKLHNMQLEQGLLGSKIPRQSHNEDEKHYKATTTQYEDVEIHALQHLGGVVATTDEDGVTSGLVSNYAWFGVTERMHESMCLLFYMFNLEPLPVPTDRVKKCRPTDIWKENHVKEVKKREGIDYAIYRVANAILDVRLQAMEADIQSRIENGESLDSIPYVGADCFPMKK